MFGLPTKLGKVCRLVAYSLPHALTFVLGGKARKSALVFPRIMHQGLNSQRELAVRRKDLYILRTLCSYISTVDYMYVIFILLLSSSQGPPARSDSMLPILRAGFHMV